MKNKLNDEILTSSDKNKKKEYKKLSPARLISGYLACAAIIGLCVWQAVISFPAKATEGAFYIVLAALAAAFAVFMTISQKRSGNK